MATVLDREPHPTRARSTHAKRKATNVSLPEDQLALAKELGINVSQACGDGLARAVGNERARRWHEENKDAIDAHNDWVRDNGMILADLQALKL